MDRAPVYGTGNRGSSPCEDVSADEAQSDEHPLPKRGAEGSIPSVSVRGGVECIRGSYPRGPVRLRRPQPLRPDGSGIRLMSGLCWFDSSRSDLGVWLNLARALRSGRRECRFKSCYPDTLRFAPAGVLMTRFGARRSGRRTMSQRGTAPLSHRGLAGFDSLVVHHAEVAELEDAHRSDRCALAGVQVRPLSSASFAGVAD